eukprot:3292361-Rhodomonas_salina.2
MPQLSADSDPCRGGLTPTDIRSSIASDSHSEPSLDRRDLRGFQPLRLANFNFGLHVLVQVQS